MLAEDNLGNYVLIMQLFISRLRKSMSDSLHIIRFGEYAYGGIFLPMPHGKDSDGEAINNNGRVNTDAEAQLTKWLSVSVPIEGCEDWVGIAIMGHPSNPEHPIPWRVDG